MCIDTIPCLPLNFVTFLESAALDSLDKKHTREYDTATEIVPHLVASETPPISFLRTADFEPVDAAKRLALYWKYRSEIFKERWLLPMTQVSSLARWMFWGCAS